MYLLNLFTKRNKTCLNIHYKMSFYFFKTSIMFFDTH
ncbi:hypothetical protein ROD_40801 [Citrobacter rodentium ICC168]|uniref:Uncharacterized protein n=1 Tax=Citrobacter rodentium (strain ICC168) TaxID=637910 RepID=D2TI08_CITRI|nr:hypothetical protein ROD_40801 [Citrobacter rodentium ICC168]